MNAPVRFRRHPACRLSAGICIQRIPGPSGATVRSSTPLAGGFPADAQFGRSIVVQKTLAARGAELRWFMASSILLTSVTGCSTVHRVSVSPSGGIGDGAPYQLNSEHSTSPATIRRRDGGSQRGTDLVLATHTLSWRDPPSGMTHEVSTLDVHRVTFRDQGRGSLEGLGIGLLAGAALGAFMGLAYGDEQCTPPCATTTSGGRAFIGGVIGAGVGAVLGGVFGYSTGHREVYTFSHLVNEGGSPKLHERPQDRDGEPLRRP